MTGQAQPFRVWMATVGLDSSFGGVASVARGCLEALREVPSWRLERVICLRGADTGAGAGLDVRHCGGSRARFVAEIARQVWQRPDLILFDHLDLAQCQGLLPRWVQSRYAVWLHGIEIWKALPRRKVRGLKGASGFLFNSQFTQAKALKFHPWMEQGPWARVVPLGLEATGLPTRGEPGANLETKRPWVLTVGRLEASRPKGHREILAVFPEVVAACPTAHWHVVGQGPWWEELRAAVDRSPVRRNITLHGFLTAAALSELYASCRIFCMPSHGEGFGLVYAEAAAHGCVCIGSTRDAAPEVIGDAGVCVALEDPLALRDALIRYLGQDDDTFLGWSNRARQRAEYFLPRRFQADLLSALDSLMGTLAPP